MIINLPFPSTKTPSNKGRRWNDEDDRILGELHGENSIMEIAEIMGRTKASIRGRVTRLDLAKKSVWSLREVLALRNAYESAGADGVLDLGKLAERFGRDKSNVCRKAKDLGLTNNKRRNVEVRKEKVNKYTTIEECYKAAGVRMKKYIEDNGHPRGMMGKTHSGEALEKISKASKATWERMSDNQRHEHTEKAMKAKFKKHGTLAPKVSRGSWKAGWREIGGQKKYYRSRWEANYARYLQWLKELGEIKDWKHECETFWFETIKRGTRSYLPDFRVWENNGESHIHEVKGWMDSRSKTKLRRMKKYYPDEKIILIQEKQYKAIAAKVSGIISDWER